MGYVSEDLKIDEKWVKSYTVGGVRQHTRSGVTWRNMNSRCNEGGSVQIVSPTYIGCTISTNFKDFQYFTNWSLEQVGYGLSTYVLEKDILHAGNRLYSEDTCVFVPQELNNFLLSRSNYGGVYPQGVTYNKKSRKFISQISINSSRVHLGYHTTPDAAHAAYVVAKEVEARRWYERLKVKEYVVDERVIERMRTWKFIEEKE